MSDPVTVNQAASIVNKIIRGEINVADAVLETAVIAEVPWLGLPFIKQLFHFILGKISDRIYAQAAMAATKLIIDYQVKREESEVINSFDNLQMAIASGDQDAINKASGNLDSAYGSIIHSDGAAPP